MSEHILNNVNPTPAEVRLWGYDEALFFMEQDEDLLLYDFEYVPVLLELTADPNCPKREYAFDILCQFCREQALARRKEGLESLEQCLELAPESDEGRAGQWADYVRRLLAYSKQRSPVDEQKALAMGRDLLIGPGRFATVRLTKRILLQWWELSPTDSIPLKLAPTTDFREYLYISKTTGVFRHTNCNPYAEADLGSPSE